MENRLKKIVEKVNRCYNTYSKKEMDFKFSLPRVPGEGRLRTDIQKKKDNEPKFLRVVKVFPVVQMKLYLGLGDAQSVNCLSCQH